MRVLRILFANLLFYLGHKLVILSALAMGYKDTAQGLKESQAHWLKEKPFKL